MALYCALVTGKDFDRPMTLAVNHNGDSDSILTFKNDLQGDNSQVWPKEGDRILFGIFRLDFGIFGSSLELHIRTCLTILIRNVA